MIGLRNHVRVPKGLVDSTSRFIWTPRDAELKKAQIGNLWRTTSASPNRHRQSGARPSSHSAKKTTSALWPCATSHPPTERGAKVIIGTVLLRWKPAFKSGAFSLPKVQSKFSPCHSRCSHARLLSVNWLTDWTLLTSVSLTTMVGCRYTWRFFWLFL